MDRLLPSSLLLLAIMLWPLLLSAQNPSPAASNEPPGPGPWPNVYADALAERLSEQGARQLAQGNPALAARTLSEALQVIKVNHGLLASRQIPVLTLLLQSRFGAADWQGAQADIAYFQWLNGNNQRNNLPAYLEGTRSLSDLLLAASALPANPVAVRHLIQARNLDWQALSTIEANLGQDNPALLPWLYRISLKHFYQVSLLRRRHLSNYLFKSDSAELVSGWSLPANEMLQMSYRVGRDSLQRIAAIQAKAATTPATHGLALVHLADWELLFGHGKQALATYQQAYRQLLAAGQPPGRIDAFFARSRALPAGQLVTSLDSDSPGDTASLVLHSWSPLYPGVLLPEELRDLVPASDASARLRADLLPAPAVDGEVPATLTGLNPVLVNLHMADANSTSPQAQPWLRQQLGQLRFRPAFRQGMPAALPGLEIHYFFNRRQAQLSATDYLR